MSVANCSHDLKVSRLHITPLVKLPSPTSILSHSKKSSSQKTGFEERGQAGLPLSSLEALKEAAGLRASFSPVLEARL